MIFLQFVVVFVSPEIKKKLNEVVIEVQASWWRTDMVEDPVLGITEMRNYQDTTSLKHRLVYYKEMPLPLSLPLACCLHCIYILYIYSSLHPL